MFEEHDIRGPEALLAGAAASEARKLTEKELAQLGISKLAYVKPIRLSGEIAFAIHAADGEPMAVAADRDLAIAAIEQHDMVPTLVH